MITNFKLNLSPQNGIINVTIIQKQIKNVYLKVHRNLEVDLSVPIYTQENWILDFLNEKRPWIDKQITKYKLVNGSNHLFNIKNGSSTQLLGKDMRIYKNKYHKNQIILEERNINIYLKNIEDDNFVKKYFNKWWRKQANIIFNKETDILYEKIFKKYDIQRPEIFIRKMKTQWGSCIPSKNKIILNEYLLKADKRYIQYVILHELTHLLYPYHNKDFYRFLTIQMPDWKQRKNDLDKDVVQWL